jgi:hypothetical protein
MSGFSFDWLALREPYDVRARNADVLATAATEFANLPSLSVVDLACGTGATLRATSAHFPRPQRWRLVDNDLGLLARAAEGSLPEGCTARTVPIDLVRDLELALDGAIDLVTTSALLDLVSAEWLDRLLIETAARRLPLYAALTYDGRAMLEPADPLDAAVIAAVNEHQHRDKGFGPALGPDAARALIERCRALGHMVTEGSSDWRFGPDDRDIQTAVLAGWAIAAREQGGFRKNELADWLERRGALAAAGRANMTLGHVDVFAQPIGRR